MFDHTGSWVSDLGASIAFHRQTLPDYGPGFFGAFLIDGDGNIIEAVCHRPKGT